MKIRYIAYILIAGIVCYLVYSKLWGSKAKESAAATAGSGKGGKRKTGPVPVKVMIVKDTAMVNQIDVTGSIDANERVNLISETAGNITGIYFTEGSSVKKGQLLVKVYNQDLQASLKQNEFQIAQAKETEYRNRILLHFAKINLTLDQIPKTIMVPTECVIPDMKSSKVLFTKTA
jgi:membrane fusion protein (multidrug efflux system)